MIAGTGLFMNLLLVSLLHSNPRREVVDFQALGGAPLHSNHHCGSRASSCRVCEFLLRHVANYEIGFLIEGEILWRPDPNTRFASIQQISL
jgi:hypothetical protein